jgi:DNA-binding response OmpR family regulator
MAEGKKILLVEDDAFVSDIYQTRLEQEGYGLVLASNGMEAMKKIEEGIPDLILLDIVMPYMDGLEVLKKLKAQEKWKKIPVIILTNLSQKEEVEEGLGIGADDYLIKSHFTPTEVVGKVRNILEK